MAAIFAALLLGALAIDRRLVDVQTRPDLFPKFTSIVGERDNIESLSDSVIKLWANHTEVKQLRAAGFTVKPGVDISAFNALEAHKRSANYTWVPGVEPDWTVFCDYPCLINRITEIRNQCGDLFSVQSIGRTVQGRDIWVWRITTATSVVPEILLAGNIHGDETTGGQLLQRFAWEICFKRDQRMEQILRTSALYIMPMFNPDGYMLRRRGNGNNADLNRDFPNKWTSPSDTPNGRQPETAAYMAFTREHDFKLSLMYHGGALVANYPYDSRQPGTSGYSATDRDALVTQISLIYSRAHTTMSQSRTFPNGVVNGAVWYIIYGSSQDFQYDYRGTIDITLEVSDVKWPAGNTLPGFYTANYGAIVAFCDAVHLI